MARAKISYSTADKNIADASRTYCAEVKALRQLSQRYQECDSLPDPALSLAADRVREARQRALQRPPTTMSGVMALARMAQADGYYDTDTLAASIIRGLLQIDSVKKRRLFWRTPSAELTVTLNGRETIPEPPGFTS